MKKKTLLILIMCMISICFVGCKHKHDTVNIFNRSLLSDDNIYIETKDGYFYSKHEKFTVDENTVGVTIYFSNNDDTWD